MVLTKRLNFLIFQLLKAERRKKKTRRRSNTLKGSQRTGVGRKSLKNLRTSTFNKDLSNETTFCPIYLAGQILKFFNLLLGVETAFLLQEIQTCFLWKYLVHAVLYRMCVGLVGCCVAPGSSDHQDPLLGQGRAHLLSLHP
jgi:hypothetical protein